MTGPKRLTALVILGIRDTRHFPPFFYRENCADMALCENDIDPELVSSAGCVTVTGTRLSHPRTETAVLKALRLTPFFVLFGLSVATVGATLAVIEGGIKDPHIKINTAFA